MTLLVLFSKTECRNWICFLWIIGGPALTFLLGFFMRDMKK